MTVAELIDELSQYQNPEDLEVVFSYFYGDYSNTEVAELIQSVSDGYIKKSEYHRMYKVVTKREDIENEDTMEAIIISPYER